MAQPTSRRAFLRVLITCATASLAAACAAPAAPSPAATPGLEPDVQQAYNQARQIIPGLTSEMVAGAKREGALSLYRLSYDFPGGFYPEFNQFFPFIKITDFESDVG